MTDLEKPKASPETDVLQLISLRGQVNGMSDNFLEQAFFEIEIGVFKDYLLTLERFLESEAEDVAQCREKLQASSHVHVSTNQPSPVAGEEARFEGDYEPLPEENDEAWYEEDYEPSPEEIEREFRDRLDVIDDFTNLLRSSFFVSLYSFLQSRLENECESRKGAHIPRSLSDIRGRNELDRIQKYFTKVLRVYFPNETPQWQEIQNYRVLRNCIVHQRGKLGGSRDARPLRDYIDRKPDLRIVGDEVFLDTAFCSEAFDTVKVFFCRLISSNKS